MIILIFESRLWPSVLAHGHNHCVTGITLPPVDATFLFHRIFGLSVGSKKNVVCPQ